MPLQPLVATEEDASTPASPLKIISALIVFVLVWAIGSGLEPRQRTVAAIFAATVVLWITEAIPLAMTALLSTTLLVVTGSLGGKEAFGAYGDQIILLFIGSFIIAKSMELSGLDRRIALWMLSKKWATRTASSALLTLGATACAISLIVSNTATTAMLLPIGRTILQAMGVAKRGHPVSTSYMLMLTWGSSIAVGTIIGTPPNVLGVGLIEEATGLRINFVQWAIFAMPITIVMLLIAWLQLRVFRGVEQPDTHSARSYAIEELGKLGRIRGSEWATIAAFAVAFTLWLLPGAVEYAAGSGTPISKAFNERFPEAVAALIGASILFLIPCRDTESNRAMTWKQANQIEWGTILLFAGGLALGKAVFDTKLAQVVGTWGAEVTGAENVWAITALSIALSILLSELASNTASASTMVPVAIALAQGAGVSPIPPALGAVIGSNLGFMLPISTAPNAIVYSSGLVPNKVMLRAGLLFDIIGFIVTLLSLWVILPRMGLAG